MDGILKLASSTLAYADKVGTSNPAKRFVDWLVNRSYQVQNPKSEPFTLSPGQALTVFSGSRNIDVTGIALTLSGITGTYNKYRVARASTEDAPGFRTDRGTLLNGLSIDVVANANLTITVTSPSASFASAVAGDNVFLPDATTGDPTSPFSPLNVGQWVVLSVSGDSTSVQLRRPAGVSFSGTTETVTVTDNEQFQTYSAAGVQVGDKVQISGGFSAGILGTYEVVGVTANRFDFISTKPLPTGETATPGSDLQFYNQSKRYIRVEADQSITLRLNGDVSDKLVLTPWEAADQDNTAFFELVGLTWSAEIVNNTDVETNVLVISAE